MLLLLLAAVPVTAQQKFHIVSFDESPLDMTARDAQHEKIDGNGDRFAIVKVTSTSADDDLRAYNFDFGYMESLVESKGSELWVYVQRNAKHVTITRSGYHAVSKYDLRTTIQPGCVYVMQLSPEAKRVLKQMVRFKISPVEAKAVVMYKSDAPDAVEQLFGTADESGSVAKSLELGKYSYRIISENCETSEGRLLLSSTVDTYIENVVLKPNFARITLNVGKAAEILVDGNVKGTGVWKGILKSGTYNIECRMANHKSSVETITVEDGKDAEFSLKAPVPITGMLSMISTPLDSRITIDGRDYGLTPCNIPDLLIGEHKVTLSKNGYKSATIDVIIKEKETTEHHVTLQPGEEKQPVTPSQGGSSGTINGHEYVDLGLPSGLLWATCNVGANAPEENGDYYAWGEAETKSIYTKENSRTYGKSNIPSNISGNPEYDAARKNWGSSWRMPTKKEFEELRKKCIWTWTSQNGKNGYKVTSKKNGNSIFLPASGLRNATSHYHLGSYGYYWSANPDVKGSTEHASGLYFGNRGYNIDWNFRYYSRPIRPVSK